jgi:hypothetical protein
MPPPPKTIRAYRFPSGPVYVLSVRVFYEGACHTSIKRHIAIFLSDVVSVYSRLLYETIGYNSFYALL